MLPSQRTLHDYKNAIRNQAGFNPAIVEQLKEDTKSFSGSSDAEVVHKVVPLTLLLNHVSFGFFYPPLIL